MQIVLRIKKNGKMRLELVRGKKAVDGLEWREENSLSRLLLAKIDEILKKNKISLDPAPNSLSKISRVSLGRSVKMANHGAGYKGWAIRPARRGKYGRRNWCGVDKISKFEIISDVPRKWTTCRIAEITLKSLALAKKIDPC
jgi:hypothetical protein